LGEGVEKKVANLAKEVEEQKAKMKEESAARAAQPMEEVAEPSDEKVASFKVPPLFCLISHHSKPEPHLGGLQTSLPKIVSLLKTELLHFL
jgi:hypothetical protein